MYYIPNPPQFPDALKSHLITIAPPKAQNDIKPERFSFSTFKKPLLKVERNVPMDS